MENSLNDIQNKIATGDLDAAIDAMLQLPLPEEQKNTVVLLAARKNRLPGFAGKMGMDEWIAQDNRIIHAMLETISGLSEERSRIFLETLVKNGLSIGGELGRDPYFVHAFAQTFQKALHTQRKEKIEFLGTLLSRSFGPTEAANIDNFEYELHLLDSLQYPEIRLITILKIFESKYFSKGAAHQLRQKSNATHWQEFLDMVKTQLNYTPEYCEAMLTGIERTGLVHFPKPGANDLRRYGAYSTAISDALFAKISPVH